jgi:hypothetical protein
MSSSRSVAVPSINRSPIRAWRIVGGAFLHFAVPAYVVIVAILTLFDAPVGASLSNLARLALGYSGWFLAGYAALAVTMMIVAAAAEPPLVARRQRREAGDPAVSAVASRLRVTRALADARTIAGGDLARLLDSIGAPRWDHDDSRFQALSQDLLQVVHVMTTANASASAKSRPEIIELVTQSLQRIDDRLGELAAERSRLDQGDARAVARYVENRYKPSDFTGS